MIDETRTAPKKRLLYTFNTEYHTNSNQPFIYALEETIFGKLTMALHTFGIRQTGPYWTSLTPFE